jgi:soluble cytochrome b562
MNPTPPPAPTNGVAVLMAEIERIAQELRAYNKRPLPATEDQVQALVQLAERDRPLTLHVNSEAVAKQLVGKVEQQAKAFQAGCDKLITLVDDRTDYLNEQMTARLSAVQAAEASLVAAAARIPRAVPLDVMANWRSTLGFTLGPLAVLLLTLLVSGHFSRVPKAELAAAQTENADIRAKNAQLVEMVRFYQGQGQAYRQKFPKAASYFPKYVPPAAPVR